MPSVSKASTLPILLLPLDPSSRSKADPLSLFPDTQGSDLAHREANRFCLGRSLSPLTVLIKALLAVVGGSDTCLPWQHLPQLNSSV